MRQIPFLNYVEYRKEEAKEMMEREFGWRDYGGKHYESVYTRFFQGYYLPTKFGFDKRRAHLSSLIVSGQMSRDEALSELQRPAYAPELLRQDHHFVLKKFGLSCDDFDAILRAPPKMEWDYPSHHFLFERMRRYKDLFRRFATTL
jgi:hypothetical protein